MRILIEGMKSDRGAEKMSPTLVRPRNRPEPTEQFGPRITQKGIMYMDNNTTLDQRSLPWMINSSMKVIMKVVHGRSPDVHGRPNRLTPDGRIHNIWKTFDSL